MLQNTNLAASPMMFFETIRIAVLNGLPMECQGKSGTRERSMNPLVSRIWRLVKYDQIHPIIRYAQAELRHGNKLEQ